MTALQAATRRAREQLAALRFGPPVAVVYAPLDYAARAHAAYLRRFGTGTKRALLLGMNPGPFGMVQTGVPFGEVEMVRDWLGIREPVDRPAREHPKRPVTGFECARSEVSGRRLWGWARDRFGTAERFFARFYVHNYCPLAFVEDSGRNRTPDKLPAAERDALFTICDDYLRAVVDALDPVAIVGVGAFAEARARAAIGGGRSFGRIPHPSPASPAANRGWAALADAGLRELGLVD
ncbi:MAG: single-stranded DNA-binding protein [Planctomycetes bacterium]|nr:single-stranded DNA-binding protein [Planctomycetota bacterium]